MVWIVYMLIVLVVSALVGLHVGRFRAACTEMTGMMIGMAMGMLNGFLLGYAAAVLSDSMFWGNLAGILLGLGFGIYYGRAGGLMGIMDGGMGGVMGGSMGAMLAVMLTFPQWAQGWTAALLAFLYVIGMLGLVALIEQSAPEYAAVRRLLPVFSRAATELAASQPPADYYELLGVHRNANQEQISDAYFDRIETAAGLGQEEARVERAFAVLSDPLKRQAYDSRLARSKAPAEPASRATTKTNVGPPPRSEKGTSPHARSSARRNVPRDRRESEPPITWVGGVGAIVLVLALAWWMYGVTAGSTGANTGSQNSTVGAAGETQAQLRQQAVPATTGADGKQNIDVVLNSATFQYEPKVIEVKQGTPVHFNLSVKNGDPGCGRVVTIRELGASVEVVPGQKSSLDFTPAQAGTYVMTCEMNMFGPGYVIVTQ